MRKIKEHGGLTLAQAEFDHVAQGRTPRSAAETGMVDHVVPVEDMPALLADYQQHLGAAAERSWTPSSIAWAWTTQQIFWNYGIAGQSMHLCKGKSDEQILPNTGQSITTAGIT